jgi:hypothetical protein
MRGKNTLFEFGHKRFCETISAFFFLNNNGVVTYPDNFTCVFSSQDMIDWLNHDTDNLVTIILTGNTPNAGGDSEFTSSYQKEFESGAADPALAVVYVPSGEVNPARHLLIYV